jgi:hypothetical protein
MIAYSNNLICNGAAALGLYVLAFGSTLAKHRVHVAQVYAPMWGGCYILIANEIWSG